MYRASDDRGYVITFTLVARPVPNTGSAQRWSIGCNQVPQKLKININTNMIDSQNFRALALHLGFVADGQEVSDVLRKTYGDNGDAIRIDFSNQRIDYPESQSFKVNRSDTCNFASSENAVVFECVNRLLEKGYKPEHIALEPEWKLGHGGKSGRADLLMRDQRP